MQSKFLPTKINIIATLTTLIFLYILEIAFSCTGLYHMVDGTPIAPFSPSEIPLSCIGNHIITNSWIYPVAAILVYVLTSLLILHKKIKN